MVTFQKIEDFLAHIQALLSKRYRPVEGALFTAVLALHERAWFLASGRAALLDGPVEARAALKYPAIHLLEEWVPGVEPAYERLRQLLSGQGFIAGEPIPSTGFRHTQEEQHWAWRPKLTGWTETFFKSEPTIPSSGNRPTVTHDPVTAFGQPPYESGAHAIWEWMHQDRSRQRHSSEPPDLGAFMTVIPDTRARIASAEWVKGVLRVHVEANVPRDQLELQCLFSESAERRDALVRSPGERVEVEVPPDAQAVPIYLLHTNGDHLGQIMINRVERTFEETSKAVPLEDQAAADIQGGENDEVEFKPFIKPADEKMAEVLETVVAFANTQGGRLYLGVDDHRRVEGRSALSRALGAKEEDARADLERALNKLLTDKIKPVPKFTTRFVELYGEPVFVVAVPRGDTRPYATFNNQIYIRKGSSNVNPDPVTELPHLFSTVPDAATAYSALTLGTNGES